MHALASILLCIDPAIVTCGVCRPERHQAGRGAICRAVPARGCLTKRPHCLI